MMIRCLTKILCLLCFPLLAGAAGFRFEGGKCRDERGGAARELLVSGFPGECTKVSYFRSSQVNWKGRSFRGMDASHIWIRGALWNRLRFDSAILREAELALLTAFHVDFFSADLRGARIRDSYWENAQAKGASFSGARFYRVKWIEGDARRSQWQRAWVQDSYFRGLDLRGADLSGVQWVNSRCEGCLIEESFPGSEKLGFRLK